MKRVFPKEREQSVRTLTILFKGCHICGRILNKFLQSLQNILTTIFISKNVIHINPFGENLKVAVIVSFTN